MRRGRKVTAVTTGIAVATSFLLSGSVHAAELKMSYQEIVEAAIGEPAVQWCTGMEPSETQPTVDAFVEMFPDVPEPNDFGCDGEEATQRVVSEWGAGAPRSTFWLSTTKSSMLSKQRI